MGKRKRRRTSFQFFWEDAMPVCLLEIQVTLAAHFMELEGLCNVKPTTHLWFTRSSRSFYEIQLQWTRSGRNKYHLSAGSLAGRYKGKIIQAAVHLCVTLTLKSFVVVVVVVERRRRRRPSSK